MHEDRERLLEDLIHHELKRLPLRQAPATLTPRVLAAIRAQARRPWWQRPLATWPRWIQVLALVSSLSIATGLAWALGSGLELVDFSSAGRAAGAMVDRLELAWHSLETLGNAAWVVLARIHPFFLASTGLLLVCAYASCVGLGTVLYRLAVNKS